MAQEGTKQNYGSYNYYDNTTLNAAGSDYSGTEGGLTYPGVWGQQDFNQNYSYSSQYSAPTQATSSGLYKTKLCRHFQMKGICNMGDKCNFAHGIEELRGSTAVASTIPTTPYSYSYAQPAYQSNYSTADHSGSKYYKTVLCRNYQETGQCQFGENCKFAHGDSEIRAPSPGGYKGAGYYGYGSSYNSYATSAPPTANTSYYGYDMNYPSYQGGESVNVSYDTSNSTPPIDPSQNYSYSYGTDQNYYQGFEGYDTSKMSGGVSAVSGKDTSAQYYPQPQMPTTSAYIGENSEYFHQ